MSHNLDPSSPPIPPRITLCKTAAKTATAAVSPAGVGFTSSSEEESESAQLFSTPSTASRGNSATMRELYKLPSALYEDMSGLGMAAAGGAVAAAAATAAAGSSAIGASLRVLLTLMAAFSAVPNTAAAITSVAAAAVVSYGAAIKSSLADPRKRKSWATIIPTPMDFIQHFSSVLSVDAFTTSACKSIIASINTLTTSASGAKLVLELAMLQLATARSTKFPHHLPYISKMSNLLFVTSAAERHTILVEHEFIAADYNTTHPDYNPPEMKARMKTKLNELLHAIIRLQHLFSEVISARTPLPATNAWQYVCNMTKPLRGAICSVTGSHYHDPNYRLNKFIIHYTLCAILHHEFCELQANYMDHLHAVRKLPLCASNYTPYPNEVSAGDSASSPEEA